jgi:hypothetical protein
LAQLEIIIKKQGCHNEFRAVPAVDFKNHQFGFILAGDGGINLIAGAKTNV